jgi:hypothetical protein
MVEADTITPYLTRFSQIRDELAAVGEIVDPSELVRMALNGFSKPWKSFVRSIMAKEHMPSWERLWDDFVQEELRFVGSGSSSQQQGEGGDESDLAFLAKGKKKTKHGPKVGAKQQQLRVSSRGI